MWLLQQQLSQLPSGDTAPPPRNEPVNHSPSGSCPPQGHIAVPYPRFLSPFVCVCVWGGCFCFCLGLGTGEQVPTQVLLHASQDMHKHFGKILFSCKGHLHMGTLGRPGPSGPSFLSKEPGHLCMILRSSPLTFF